ncbi:glycosyltransferase family 2 protein [Turicibacter sanguinis]|uniref:glycosyltransferase family 2 protein n=1 Tax=Turicibacter sanguinis TaxID=154288 RepID=UPI00189728B5|nr:glycosyltransferase family 2 protein [Turicibacter sanguinis]MDB8555543.1 glycosyltransferase family 2 protein [Turicibacter sanguinis]
MIDKKPLVSVVIPTYKRPDMIVRAIKSVQHQTYKNIEIIIVDDNGANTEMQLKTAKEIEEFKHDVSYLIHNKNKGGSAARNTGWLAATGDYITFLDDDDEIEKTKIEKQISILESLDDSWGACYTGYKVLKKNGKNQISTECRQGDCYIDALMRTMFMGSGSNLLLRKRVVDEINGYDESFIRNQDIEFLTRALEKHKLAYVDEVLLTIHQEGDRMIRSFEQLDDYTKHYLKVFQSRIDALESNERQRVIAIISLERCRVAFYKKEYVVGINILRENDVSMLFIYRYIKYIIKRMVTKKSYGFSGL